MGQRPFVVLSLAVLAVTHAAADDIAPAALGPRTVRFTYEARVTPPAGTRVLEMWLPLPREDDQRVLDVKLAGGAAPTVMTLSPSGDRAAHVRVAAPKGTRSLTETATLVRREVRGHAAVG